MGSYVRKLAREKRSRLGKATSAAQRAVERCKPMARLTQCRVRLIVRTMKSLAPRIEVSRVGGITRDVKMEIVSTESILTKVWEDRLIAAMKRLVERTTVPKEKQS